MIKTSTIVWAVALVAVALGGLLVANALAGGAPPGQDPCSHGATGKACRPDPQPDNGKDCLHHGQEGGVNEDHCGPTTPTTTSTPTTTATPPSSTVTVTTPGATTTTPGRTTTVTTPAQTVTSTTTLPGITVTNSPTSTVVVQAPPAQPAVTSTVTSTVTRTVTTGAGVSPARAGARTKVRVVHRTRVVHARPRVVYRTRVRVVHEKCQPIRVCGAGLVGKPPRCGAAGKG